MTRTLSVLASLRVTVALFALAIFIVLAGTLAQVDKPLVQVLEEYFRTAVAFVEFRLFLPRHLNVRGGLWLPGGWLIAAALLVNVLAAHAVRFRAQARGTRLATGIAVTLLGAAVTGWVIHRGSLADLTAQQGDSYWRILYQLLQGGAAAAVLLAGGLLIFRRRAGVVLLHAGIVLMIVSDLVTGTAAVEATMTLREGETASHLSTTGEYELAMIDHAAPDHDDVVVIPATRLMRPQRIDNDLLPVTVETLAWWVNTSPAIDTRRAPQVQPDPRVTAGLGLTHAVRPQPRGAGVEGLAIDAPAALVRFTDKMSGADLGTFLVAAWFDADFNRRAFDGFQTLIVGDKTYEIALRPKRIQLPYRITLNQFTHDVYPGTSTPRDFASDIVLNDPAWETTGDTSGGGGAKPQADGGSGEENPGVSGGRPVRIWMNNPMRYGGRIFYQSSFLADDSGTVLQVMANPGWMTPYVACMIVATGMGWHFGAGLVGFMRRRGGGGSKGALPLGSRRNGRREGRGGIVAAAVLVIAGGWLVSRAWESAPAATEFDLRGFGELPVMYEGRVQPVDTLARNALRILSGKQTCQGPDGQEHPAVRWLLDAVTHNDEDRAILRIESLELQQALGLAPRQGYRYAPAELSGDRLHDVLELARRAAERDPSQRDRFDRQALRFVGDQWMLRDKLIRANTPPPARPDDLPRIEAAHDQLLQQGLPMLVQPGYTDQPWRAVLTAWLQSLRPRNQSQPPDEQLMRVTLVFAAYARKDPAGFNRAVARLHEQLLDQPPAHYHRARVNFEAFFNHLAPFYHCAVLYVFAFVLTAIGWLYRPAPLHRAAGALLLLALAVHTIALIGRIYISGRPPVTNLYSSAVFIGWAAVGAGMVLERLSRAGLGYAAAAIAGFATLLIAHFLAGDGDTFVVLQAVLDTNFWLATHVVCIALGYAATFLAGLLAILFILRGVFTRTLGVAAERELARMIYGTVCFGLLLSFVGTVLGGLWADDSWGRFWGWDPKENGALILVLWNALVLHARWGGMIRLRGLAVCAVIGNIVTAWSWFGVNQLAVGLHSYGFTDSATLWLLVFVNSQIVLVALGLMPRRYWPSYAERTAAA